MPSGLRRAAFSWLFGNFGGARMEVTRIPFSEGLQLAFSGVDRLTDLLRRLSNTPWHRWYEFCDEAYRIIEDPITLAALADVLPNCDDHVRLWFARNIREIRPALVPLRFEFLIHDPDEQVRVTALTAYAAAKPLSETTLNLARGLLRSKRLVVFEDALKLLMQQHDHQLPDLLEALFPCEHLNIRGRAASALAAIGEHGIASLNRLAHHGDAETRAVSAKYLDASSSEIIVRLLGDEAEIVRAAAGQASGRAGLACAEEPLLLLAKNPGTLEGKAALRALGKLRSESALPLFIECLRSQDPELCVLAAETMATAGYSESEKLICSRFDEAIADDASLQWRLIKALVPIATRRSISRFEMFLARFARSRRLTKRQRRQARAFIPVWIFRAGQR